MVEKSESSRQITIFELEDADCESSSSQNPLETLENTRKHLKSLKNNEYQLCFDLCSSPEVLPKIAQLAHLPRWTAAHGRH